jgi:hypothetical protein
MKPVEPINEIETAQTAPIPAHSHRPFTESYVNTYNQLSLLRAQQRQRDCAHRLATETRAPSEEFVYSDI